VISACSAWSRYCTAEFLCRFEAPSLSIHSKQYTTNLRATPTLAPVVTLVREWITILGCQRVGSRRRCESPYVDRGVEHRQTSVSMTLNQGLTTFDDAIEGMLKFAQQEPIVS
jgi:hypothetical protein